MINDLQHDLNISRTRDETSRQELISCLRGYLLNDMAAGMQRSYEEKVEPRFERENKRAPANGPEVHKAMKDDLAFKFYSSVRYNAQEMVWQSVIPVVERHHDELIETGNSLREDKSRAKGSLSLNPNLPIPRAVSEIDVHLAPGSYHSEYAEDDLAVGSIYDNGLNVFAFNQMGANLNDIGMSMSNFVRLKYPDFQPKKILDCGCTVGHNSVPWAQTYPDAEVHAIDVSAPILRYASARAQAQGADVHFEQMNATSMEYENESFDMVFSSMFLHELPLKDIRGYFAEARRVLKPGGLLLNMELPPNDQLAPYDSFYLDWDCYYNQEPFYKCFRDQDYQELCTTAGFEADNFVQFIMPQYTNVDESSFAKAVENGPGFDDKTGRLTGGVRWFGFGAWK